MESEQVPLQLPSPSHKRRRIDVGPDVLMDDDDRDQSGKKYYFAVFCGFDGFSYLSIPISSLFNSEISTELHQLEVNNAPFGFMQCFCLKDSLYLLGGYSLDYTSRDLMRLEILSSKLRIPKHCKRSPMLLEKQIPVILEHQNIIYVLSNWTTPSPHYFECYKPERDKWCKLKNPPFYDVKSLYNSNRGCNFSYLVMDGKICISLEDFGAFAYDIGVDEWGPCHLFSSESEHAPDDSKYGLPFDFIGQGIVAGKGNNKYLIAIRRQIVGIFAEIAVAAYAISDGKVIKRQILFDFSRLFGMENVSFNSLFALGEDLYCLTFSEARRDFMWLIVLTFRASAKEDSEGCDEFIDFKFCEKCKIQFVLKNQDLVSVLPFAG